ncbi:transposase, partial [Corynebacterium variabile]|uniref:transposase n=1 Tax=Corynebacterium variabile TaxID=1727 RepID=UPI003FD3996A
MVTVVVDGVGTSSYRYTTLEDVTQRETTGRRGRKDDPLYKHRRALLTRTNFLTDRQKQRLDLLWDTDD